MLRPPWIGGLPWKTGDVMKGPWGGRASSHPYLGWALDHVLQDSTFTCAATARTCWGYVGDPSAANPTQLITGIGANVQAIVGGRWVAADSKFYTTTTTGETLNPYTLKSTPSGTVKVFTAYADWATGVVTAIGKEVAATTTAGNRCYLTCTTAETTDTLPAITDANVAANATITETGAGADVVWRVGGYATGLAEQLEAASENEVTDSREFDAASWTVVNAVGRTANAVGVDGVANAAYTITDDDGAAYEGTYDLITVPDDSNTHVGAIFVKKDTDETRFPEIHAVFAGGGSGIQYGMMFNTKTGATSARINTASGTVDVQDYGEWWRIVTTATNDTSGNVQLLYYIYPARGTVIGTANVAATGSIIVDQCDIRLNQSFMDSAIITSGTTLARAETLFKDTSEGRLSAESGAGRIVVNPKWSNTAGWWFSTFTDGNNFSGIYQASTGVVRIRNKIATSEQTLDEVYSPVADTPFVIEFYYNSAGQAIRAYAVGTDPSGVAWATNADTRGWHIPADFQVGSFTGTAHVTSGYISCELSTNKEDLNFE